jgi:hypothetical protein
MFSIIQPEITNDFILAFDESDGTEIKTLIDFSEIISRLIIPDNVSLSSSLIACKINAIQCQYNLSSIKEVIPPNIYPEDSASETSAKIQKSLSIAPYKTVGFYKRKTGENWVQVGQSDFQNHGGWSFRQILSPLIDDGLGLYSTSSQIGANILNSGSGTLKSEDTIIFMGSTIVIPTLIEKIIVTPQSSSQPTTLEAFTENLNFSQVVTNLNPVQILPERPNRKELRLTTNKKIWFRFGSSSNGVAKGSCAFLDAGGALTYENGRLAFEGGRGELIAVRYTQGFPLWAIADSETAFVSGEEFW